MSEAIDLNDIRQILRLAWDDAVVYNKCFAMLWHANQ